MAHTYDLAAAAASLDPPTLHLIRRVLCSHAPPSTPLPELLPQLTSSAEVDLQLFALLALICRDFVVSWYSRITNDTEFVRELITVVGSVVREVERRVQNIDLTLLLLDELPAILEAHIKDYRLAKSRTGTSLAPHLTTTQIFHNLQPHPALASRDSERLYLKLVAAGLVAVLLPVGELESDCVRALVREVLAGVVLKGTMERLSEPWVLYEIVVKVVGLVGSEGVVNRVNGVEGGKGEKGKVGGGKEEKEKEKPKEKEKEKEKDKPPHRRRSSTASKPNGHPLSEKRPPTPRLPPTPPPPPPPPPPPSHPTLSIPPTLDTLLTLTSRALSLLRTFLTTLLHTLHTPPPPPPRLKPLLSMSIFPLITTTLNLPSLQPWLLGNLALLSRPFTSRSTRPGAVLDTLLSEAVRRRLQSSDIAVSVLASARGTLFPGNGPMAPGRPEPTSAEKERVRRGAEEAVLRALPGRVRALWAREGEVGRWLEVWGDKEVNKHLLYSVLDLVVGRVVPELVEMGPAEVRRGRVSVEGE